MAIRTISNAGGSWGTISAWVEGVVPTAIDDVVATATSGAITLNGMYGNCRSIDLANYTGTLTSNGYGIYVGTSTYKSDLVSINIPANVAMSSISFYLYNQSAVELTVFIGNTDATKIVSIAASFGKYKLLSNLYCVGINLNGSDVSKPVVFDTNGMSLNLYTGIQCSYSYNTLKLTNSTLNYLASISYSYTYFTIPVGMSVITGNTVLNIFNAYTTNINISTASADLGDFSINIKGLTAAINVQSNLAIKDLIIAPVTSMTLTITSGKTLTTTGKFAVGAMTGVATLSGGTISKSSGVVNFYSVNSSSMAFTGGATWNALHNCTVSNCTGINVIGGKFFVDLAGGDDSINAAYGWWKVTYSTALGLLPILDEIGTGSISGALCKVTGRINEIEWAAGSGTLYFYGKVGTFQAETVNLTGGSSFVISADLTNSAWKSAQLGGLTTRIGPADTLCFLKSPEPTSLEQLAKWTSTTRIGGGIIPYVNPTSSTNTSPIVITKAAHGFVTGTVIHIYSHTINTNANGVWIITKLTDNTFSLDSSVGNGIGGATGLMSDITSKIVMLTMPVNKTICLCDSPWTAGVNVSSALLDSSDWKFSAGSVKIITASAGANQILAKFALSAALDLSGYKQISFWFKNISAVTNTGDLLLKLYSDTACTIEVESFSIPGIPSTSRWVPFTINKALSLNSSVQGIALYTTVVQSSKTFYIDNIIACKDSALPDSITLQSLISKNISNQEGDDVFCGIQSIKNNIIILDIEPNTTAQQGQGYQGITENVTLYKRESFKVPMASAYYTENGITPKRAGIITKYFGIIGGWSSASNLEEGITVADGLNGFGYGAYDYYANYSAWRNFHFLRFYKGFNGLGITSGYNIIATNSSNTGIFLSGIVSNWNLFKAFYNAAGGVYIGATAIISSTIITKNNIGAGLQVLGALIIADVISNNNSAYGIHFTNSSLGATKISSVLYNGTGVLLNSGSPFIVIDEIVDANFNTTGIQFSGSHGTVSLVRRLNNNATACYFTGGSNSILKEISQVNNSTVVVLQLGSPQNCKILKIAGDQNKALISGSIGDAGFYIYNGAFTNTITATNKILIYSGMLYLINWNTALVTSDIYIGAAYFYNSRIVFHALNTRDNHISYCDYGIIKSDATERHSLTGISWKFSPSNLARDIKYPLDLSIAKVVCVAGKTTQVAIWVKKSHATDISGRLVIIGGKVPGVGTPTQNVFVEAVNVTDWQQISMSFTPTYTEVVEIEFWAYWQANAATQSIWIDDISIV